VVGVLGQPPVPENVQGVLRHVFATFRTVGFGPLRGRIGISQLPLVLTMVGGI
jgi:hypothetical protein